MNSATDRVSPIKSYPKILPLVGKYADMALNTIVEVTEKVDGSMFAFGKDHNGKLHFRSKGALINHEAWETGGVPNLFRPAVEHILSVEDKLPRGICYYGETLCAPRHNTLAYERVPKNHIALFGMFDWDRTGGVDHATITEAADWLGVDVVPLLGHFEYGALNQFVELLHDSGKSYLGGADMEGIVIKDYTRPMEFGGMVYPLTALKYVSEAFKEKHSKNDEYTPQRDKLEELFSSYRTEARWNKAIQHLRDKGELVGEPKDIGILMKELWDDWMEEEKDDFKEKLFAMFKKRVAGRIQSGFPEYYKQKLLTQEFNI